MRRLVGSRWLLDDSDSELIFQHFYLLEKFIFLGATKIKEQPGLNATERLNADTQRLLISPIQPSVASSRSYIKCKRS